MPSSRRTCASAQHWRLFRKTSKVTTRAKRARVCFVLLSDSAASQTMLESRERQPFITDSPHHSMATGLRGLWLKRRVGRRTRSSNLSIRRGIKKEFLPHTKCQSPSTAHKKNPRPRGQSFRPLPIANQDRVSHQGCFTFAPNQIRQRLLH